MKKILVIVGPTASGKSELAVKLAKKFNGEIISADSRQVYRGLDIGTGKITKQEMRGVPHYLLDVANPKKQFSVADYKQLAEHNLRYIVSCGKLPIVTGGSGFYIDALTGRIDFPNVPPNHKLREKLSKKSAEVLFKILRKKNPKRAETIDPHNKVRLIRALEIIHALGHVPLSKPSVDTVDTRFRQFIYIGLKQENLEKMIRARLVGWIKNGLVNEVKKLHADGMSWKRMNKIGLVYHSVGKYLIGKISKEEMIEEIFIDIKHYAKRQMTWFKRNKEIRWFTLSAVEGFKPENYKEIEKYVRRMLG